MEEGRLTDSFGRHVDFRNAILIMTSNLGSQNLLSSASLGFGKTDDETSYEDRKKRMHADVMIEVERHFRPEFLNRIDELIIFNPLSREDLQRIVHLQLKQVLDRIAEKGIEVDVDEKAISFLIQKGYSPDYGARPLRRAIERYLEDPLAEQLLRSQFGTGSKIAVSAKNDDAEELLFEIENVPTLEPEPEQAPVEAKGD